MSAPYKLWCGGRFVEILEGVTRVLVPMLQDKRAEEEETEEEGTGPTT